MVIPSLTDPSVAPPGKHVHVLLRAVRALQAARRDLGREARGVRRHGGRHASPSTRPTSRSSILHRQVLTPLDLERELGLTEGNIFQGELTPRAALLPAAGAGLGALPHADRASLYMCGSATHPGGGIMGAPGRLAALEMLKDWKRGKRRVKADVVVIGGGPQRPRRGGAARARPGSKPLVLERRDDRRRRGRDRGVPPRLPGLDRRPPAGPLARPRWRRSSSQKHGLELHRARAARLRARCPDGRGARALRRSGAHGRASSRASRRRTPTRYPEFHALARPRSPPCSRTLLDADAARRRRSPTQATCSRSLGLGWAFRGLGRADAPAPAALGTDGGGGLRVGVVRDRRCCARSSAARGIHGHVRRALVGRHDREPAAPGRGRRRQRRGRAVLVKGGLGALTAALASAAARRAAPRSAPAPRSSASPPKDGRVTGVVLAGGEEIAARAVVSGARPEAHVPAPARPRRCSTPTTSSASATTGTAGMASKVNLALVGPAALHGARGRRGGCSAAASTSAPTIDDLERAFDDAKYGGISRRPYLDVTIPSLSDPSLAPAGQHVMSVYVQYTPYTLQEGTWPARATDEVGDAVLRTLEEYAPGIGRLVRRPAGADAARPRGARTASPAATRRTASRRSTSSSWRGRCSGWAATARRSAASTCAARAPTRAAASPAAPGANAAREILRDLA